MEMKQSHKLSLIDVGETENHNEALKEVNLLNEPAEDNNRK